MTDHILEPTTIHLDTALLAGKPSLGILPDGVTLTKPMGVVTHVILPNRQVIELPEPFFIEITMTLTPLEEPADDGNGPPSLEIVQ